MNKDNKDENINETSSVDDNQKQNDDINHENAGQSDQDISSDQETENIKLKNQLAKMQADYENYLRRSRNERELEIFQMKKKIFHPLLARVDDLERIMKNTPDTEKKGTLFEAVESLHNMLIKDLKNHDIHPFVSVGLEPDPELHDVMTQAPGEEGIILEEFQKGYKIGDEILREAKVVVGNGVEL